MAGRPGGRLPDAASGRRRRTREDASPRARAGAFRRVASRRPSGPPRTRGAPIPAAVSPSPLARDATCVLPSPRGHPGCSGVNPDVSRRPSRVPLCVHRRFQSVLPQRPPGTPGTCASVSTRTRASSCVPGGPPDLPFPAGLTRVQIRRMVAVATALRRAELRPPLPRPPRGPRARGPWRRRRGRAPRRGPRRPRSAGRHPRRAPVRPRPRHVSGYNTARRSGQARVRRIRSRRR